MVKYVSGTAGVLSGMATAGARHVGSNSSLYPSLEDASVSCVLSFFPGPHFLPLFGSSGVSSSRFVWTLSLLSFVSAAPPGGFPEIATTRRALMGKYFLLNHKMGQGLIH